MKKRSANPMEDIKRELEAEQHRYLRSHGWQYTSSTPGCLWMWVKRCEVDVTDDGQTVTHKDGAPQEPCWIMVNTDTAISMQRHSCAIRGNKW